MVALVRNRTRSIFSLIALGLLTVSCACSFAEDKRPEKGSVAFGAEKKPDIKMTSDFAAFKNVFADVAEKVIPTVVTIIATANDTVMYQQDPLQQFFYGTPFDEFFGDPRQNPRGRNAPQQQRQIIPRQGMGSGFIVSKDGYIMTNAHVVGDADDIEVRLTDNRKFSAKVIGVDSLSDVAVIKINEKVDNLPVAYLGDSDKLRVGDWVVAIGNPFNFTSTVTTGIVSGLRRRAGEGMQGAQGAMNKYQNFIQTDAAINPGNSGGALVNLDGEVIGINTMIVTPSGAFAGIGLAIPMSMAHWIMEDIVYKGKVSRGFLGVNIQPVSEETREAMGLPFGTQGALVGSVIKGQAADRAGVKTGDVITAINGTKISTVDDLRNTVASINPGKKAPLSLYRAGKEITLEVQLGDLDKSNVKEQATADDKTSDKPDSDNIKKLGATVADITADLRKEYRLKEKTLGIIITAVEQGALANRSGLDVGDIIREVKVKGQETKAVGSVKEFTSIIDKVKHGEPFMLLIERNGNTTFVVFKLKK